MSEEQQIKSEFSVGDLVFAKMKSYPPWPAKVVDVSALASPGQQPKICVQFLGTNEIGYIRENDLFDYAEFREKFSIDKKIKGFREGLKIIAELYEQQQKMTIENCDDGRISNIFDDNACSTSKNESLKETVNENISEQVDKDEENSNIKSCSLGSPKRKKRNRIGIELSTTPTLSEKRIRKSKVFSDDFILTDPILRHMLDQSMEDILPQSPSGNQRQKKKKINKKNEIRKSQVPWIDSKTETTTAEIDNFEFDTTGKDDIDQKDDDTMPMISEAPILPDQNISSSQTPKPSLKVKLLSKSSKKRKLSSDEEMSPPPNDDDSSPPLETTAKKAKFPKIKLAFKSKTPQFFQNDDRNIEQISDMPTLEMADEDDESRDDPPRQGNLDASPVIKLERYDEKSNFKDTDGFKYFLKLERAKKSSTLHVFDEKFIDKIKKEWSNLSENAKSEYEDLADDSEKPDQFEPIDDEKMEAKNVPFSNSAVKKEKKIKKEKIKDKKLNNATKMKPSLKVPKLSPLKKKTVPLSTSLPDDFQLILQPMAASSSSRNADDSPAAIEVGPAEARYRWWLYQSSSTTGPQKKASRENSPPRPLTNDMLSDTTAVFRILSKTFQQMGNKLMQKSTLDAKIRSNQQAAMLDCVMDGFMVCMVQVLGALRYTPVLNKCYPEDVMDDLMEKTSILTPL